MRLVSDFDGVWTQPMAEAEAQGEVMAEKLTAWAPAEVRPRVGEWLAHARAAVFAEPTRYGWAPNGRLSAFGDEDPFATHGGVLHFLHLAPADDTIAAALRHAVEASGLGLERFGSHCHAEGVARVVATRGPGILPAAAAAGHRLLDAGVDVAVASNSGPDKLHSWFTHAGLPSLPHPERAPRTLRLRGHSRKYALDPERHDPLALGDVQIETARPHYEQILREERPAAIVGDVFSIDLALPLALKRRESNWREVRLFWLLQPYTPAWLRALVAKHAGGEVEPVEGGMAEVAAALGA